jgi:hypothetical protein
MAGSSHALRPAPLGELSGHYWRTIRFPGPRSFTAAPRSAKLPHEEPDAVILRFRYVRVATSLPTRPLRGVAPSSAYSLACW